MISILNHTSTLAGIAATVIGLRWWMAAPTRVLREITALADVPPSTKAALRDYIYTSEG